MRSQIKISRLYRTKKGTTTDPVEKTMELLPLGPVVIIDTAGFDDGGTLGTMRVERTKAVLNRVDIAVLVVDGTIGMTSVENELVSLFEEKKIPYLIVSTNAICLTILLTVKSL